MGQLLKTQTLIDQATHNMYDAIMSASEAEHKVWIGIGALAGSASIFTSIPFTVVPIVVACSAYVGYKLSQSVVGRGGIFYKLMAYGKVRNQKEQISNMIANIRKDSLSPYEHVNLYNTVKIQECLIDTLEAYTKINAMGHSDLVDDGEIVYMENTIKSVQDACDNWGKKIGSVQEELDLKETKNSGKNGEKENYKFTLVYGAEQKYIIYVPGSEIDIFLANINIFDSNLFLGNIYSKTNILEVFLERNIKLTKNHYEQFLYFTKMLHSQTFKRFYHSTIISGENNLNQLRRIFNTFLQYEEKHNVLVVDWHQIDNIIRPILTDNGLEEEYRSIKRATYIKKIYGADDEFFEGASEAESLSSRPVDMSVSAFNNEARVSSVRAQKTVPSEGFYLNAPSKKINYDQEGDGLALGENEKKEKIGELGRHVGQLSNIFVPQSVAQLLSNDIEVDLALESLKARKVLFMQSRQDVMQSWTNLNRSKSIIEANLSSFDVGAKKEISILLDENLQEVLDVVAQTTASPMTQMIKHQLTELCLARIFFIELHLSKYIQILEQKKAMEFGGQIQYQKNKAQYDYLKAGKD